MKQIVTPDSAAHWYKPDGTPVYQVPYADKKRAGEMRDTTLSDAKKMRLFPSVTEICKVIAKPGLESYKQNELVLSALTIPDLPGETADTKALRVIEEGRKEGADAADFGTQVHKAILEDYVLNSNLPNTTVPMIHGAVYAFAKWRATLCLSDALVEHCVAHPSGYAGRYDLCAYSVPHNGYVLVDIKTQKTKPGKPFKVYLEHGMQLFAYADALSCQSGCDQRVVVAGIGFYVSSTEHRRCAVAEWRVSDDTEHAVAFDAALELWQITNGYEPATGRAFNPLPTAEEL